MLLGFLPPAHTTDILCPTDSGVNYTACGPPFTCSLEHRASLDCDHNDLWPVHSYKWAFMELRSVVARVPFLLMAFGFVPFLLTPLLAVFLGLTLGAYVGAHLLITPGLGALQVTLALPDSSRSTHSLLCLWLQCSSWTPWTPVARLLPRSRLPPMFRYLLETWLLPPPSSSHFAWS